MSSRGLCSTRLDEKDKQTINTFNLLSHYIATGVIDGIPLAYVQTELFDWEKLFIAENIRRFRMRNNLTMVELANKLNVSYSSLAKYEEALRKPPDSTLRKFARFFKVDVSEFKKEVDV